MTTTPSTPAGPGLWRFRFVRRHQVTDGTGGVRTVEKSIPRIALREIVIRELHGADERAAGVNVDALGPKTTTLIAELIKMSIYSVDGVRVEVPGQFPQWEEWNSRTRNFVLNAYRSINGADEGDLEDFLSGGEPLAACSPPSSGTGPTGGPGSE